MKERILKEDISYFADTFPFSAALEGKTIAVTGSNRLVGRVYGTLPVGSTHRKRYQLTRGCCGKERAESRENVWSASDEISYYSYDFSCVEPFTPTKR